MNTTTQIPVTISDGRAPLYHRYPRQTQAQDAYIELDPNARTASMTWNAEIGNAIPTALWHHQLVRVSVPNTLSNAQCQELAAEVQPLLLRICEGYERVWDGSNHVGRYSEDARAAITDLENLCADLSGEVNVFAVDDWCQACPIGDLVLEGETAETAAVRLIEEAWAEQRAILDGDVADYLQERINNA